MPTTVREALNQMRCVYNISDEILDTNVGSRNIHEVTFVMPCGHKKTCKASTLVKQDQCCKTCKLLEEYGYDPDNCRLTCKKCQTVSYEVPRTNLNKFVCIHCLPGNCSIEHQAFKMIHERLKTGEYVTRTSQYPGDLSKKKTADMKIVLDSLEYYVEIDEKSHLSKHGSTTHLGKDLCAKDNSIQIVRFFSADVCEETIDKTINFLRLWSDSFSANDPIIVVNSAAAKKFYSHKKLGYSFDREYSDIFWKNGGFFYEYEAPVEPVESVELEEDLVEADLS